ncbi:MAG: hypothetical protein AAF909_10785 [Pseudomonadota bacterium]
MTTRLTLTDPGAVAGGGDLSALRRLARRLGVDPDAAAAARAAAYRRRPAATADRSAHEAAERAARLSSDHRCAADAAICKGEGMVAGRAAGRALLEAAEAVSSSADAMDVAATIARADEAMEIPPRAESAVHWRAGFTAAIAPFVQTARDHLEKWRDADRARRLKAALREVLADEIDESRAQGDAPEAAAAILIDRADLVSDLPIELEDLAALGLSIAEEAAPDPALARALIDAAAYLAEGALASQDGETVEASALRIAPLRPLASVAMEAILGAEAAAALRSGAPEIIDAALAPKDLARELPTPLASGPRPVTSERLLALSRAADRALESEPEQLVLDLQEGPASSAQP